MSEKTIEFEIGQVPQTVPHLFADLVELLLCFGDYSEVSKSDVEQVLRHGDGDLDPNIDILTELEPHTSAEQQDKVYRLIDDCFLQLDYRRQAFRDAYPFEISGNILSRHKKITPARCLYLALLVCSRMRSFPKPLQQKLSSYFEIISKEAMRAVMPASAEVRIFGANSDDRKNHYGTDLRVALRKLGMDLSELLNEESIKQESSSGDSGLDLVGYVRFQDSAKGSIAFFGQCAAREREWPKKTFEAHPDRFGAFFNFVHKPALLVFIPICYRQTTGEWVKHSSSHGSILLDRLRICNLLKQSAAKLKPCNIFDEVLPFLPQ